MDGLTVEALDAASDAVNASLDGINEARMDRPDARLIRDEFLNASDLLSMACDIGKEYLEPDRKKLALGSFLKEMIAEHRRLWLRRNRPGGLDDSCARLEARANTLTQVGARR